MNMHPQQQQQGYGQQGYGQQQPMYQQQQYNQQNPISQQQQMYAGQQYGQYQQQQQYPQQGAQPIYPNNNQQAYPQHPNAYVQNQNQYGDNNQSYNVGMKQQARNDVSNNQVQLEMGGKNKKNQPKQQYVPPKKKGGFYSRFVNEDLSGTIFEDPTIRRRFVRKVLCIITCQLLLSTLFCLGAVFNKSYRDFLAANYYIYIFCWAISIGCMLILYCKREQARKVPNNYWLLGIFTTAESYMLSYQCAFTQPEVILLACGITSLLVIFLIIYATKTKRDITQKANLFFYGGIALLVLCIVGLFYQNYIFHVIISLAIIFFFSAYLVFDIQRLQGNRQVSYDIDDYIIASLDIYLDIIIILRQIMYLLGSN